MLLQTLFLSVLVLSPVSVSGSPLSKGSSGSALGVSGLDVASSEPVTGKKIQLWIYLSSTVNSINTVNIGIQFKYTIIYASDL